MGNDSPPHLSFNFQITMPKRKSRSEMGLLNTLQAGVLGRLLRGGEPAPVGTPLQGARHAHPPQDLLRAGLSDTHGVIEVKYLLNHFTLFCHLSTG